MNYAAIRAFHRVIRPYSIVQDEALEADAFFDGGEFSVPAHSRIWQEIEERVAEKVGGRFGILGSQLLDDVRLADNQEFHRMLDAMYPPEPPTCTDPEMHSKYEDRGIGDQCPHCLVSSDPGRLDMR